MANFLDILYHPKQWLSIETLHAPSQIPARIDSQPCGVQSVDRNTSDFSAGLDYHGRSDYGLFDGG